MLINFFNKTMSELNLQINIADLTKNKMMLSRLNNIKNILVKETEELATNSEFLLGFKNDLGRMELLSNEGFTIKEIENVAFIQPLDVLSEDNFDALENAIAANLNYFPNKRIIIIPYNIKSMTATMITKPK